MEINIISIKLLFYSVIIAVVIIVLNILIQQPPGRLSITVCNEQDTLDVYVRYHTIDILINPSSVKNSTFCLSKNMPFYDRTIEYLINPSKRFEKEIGERYTVSHIITNSKIKLGEFNLDLKSQNIVLGHNLQKIVIYKRPLQSSLNLYSKGPSIIPSLIIPGSSETMRDLLIKNNLDYQEVKNGDFIVMKY